MKKFIVGCVAALIASVSGAVELKQGHPTHYIVKKGDTLWDISKRFLSAPWEWPEIWHANPEIKNPHLIYPGDQLALVYIDGQPRLVTKRGGQSGVVKVGRTADGTVRLSPKVRVSEIDQAIPAIPLEKIRAFLSDSRILDTDLLANAPYVVAGKDRRLVSGAADILYARGKFEEGVTMYKIYRKGRVFYDPNDKKQKTILGIEALEVGSAKVISLDGNIATLRVNRSGEEIKNGDRLLVADEQVVNATFFPNKPFKEIKDGLIMAVEGGVSSVGTLDVIILNKGQRDGLENGNVLAIYKRGEVVDDKIAEELITLPDAKAGLMMVFKSFDKMAYGLVLDSQAPLSVGDKVRNP